MSKLIRLILMFILLMNIIENSYAQRWKRMRREVSLSLISTNFLGELGGKNSIGTNDIKDFDAKSIRPGIGAGFYYRISNMSAYQIKTSFAMISGNDNLTLEPFRNNRNLHFRSPIFELSGQLDIYLLMKRRSGHKYSFRGVRGRSLNDYVIYSFIGAGMFWFDPWAKDTRPNGDDKWHRLRPLGTEGQGIISTRKRYSLFQPCLPVGLGMRFALNRFWMIGIEYGYRHTFTDYMDDVSSTYFDPAAIKAANGENGDLAVYLANPSPTKDVMEIVDGKMNYLNTAPGMQRGDPRDKDAYMFATISVFYKLPKRGFAIPKF